MKLSELPPTELARRLRDGLCWRVGPFVVRLVTRLDYLARHLGTLYGQFPLVEHADVVDAHVSVGRVGWTRRRASIYSDGGVVFRNVPMAQVVPLTEWTLNLCAFHRPCRHLLVHAAVVERDGLAAILPGDAGSGKSTLCAALVHRGWRLLSDEVAPVQTADGCILPVPRPIGLKEQSIEAIRQFAPQAVFGPIWPETAKGRLVHVLAPEASVRRMDEPARPAWVIFPSYTPGAEARLEPLGKPKALLHCATNAFNYDVLGRLGFETAAQLIDRCDCYRYSYSDLEQAVAGMDALWTSASGGVNP